MLFRRGLTATARIAALACTAAVLVTVPAGAAAGASARVGATQAQTAERRPKVKARAEGRPPASSPIRPGTVFSYPNRTKRERVAIHQRLVDTIDSTWGGPRYRSGSAYPGNGSIRIASWTVQDWPIVRALYRAHRRGVTVQVLAAKAANRDSRPWKWLRQRLRSRLYAPGRPETRDRWSFARHCYGSCRGRGGTAHSKYLLFSNVGSRHRRTITVQSSMNLSRPGYYRQWNTATTSWRPGVHRTFSTVFRESRRDKPVPSAYRSSTDGPITSAFLPRPGTTAEDDPVMRALRQVRCTGATKVGTASGRTRIRAIQYAVYDTRGVWLAKRIRALYNAGCDVKIVYSAISRPVLSILRSRSGRGAVPMRQSVIRDSHGRIVKYNHSKWLTINGRWGGSTRASVVLTGSANWGNLAFSNDEQLQQIRGYASTRPFLLAFAKTWKQQSSRRPRSGRVLLGGRVAPGLAERAELVEAPERLVFGKGDYRFLPED